MCERGGYVHEKPAKRGSWFVKHNRGNARFEASKRRPASSLPNQNSPNSNFCGFYATWRGFKVKFLPTKYEADGMLSRFDNSQNVKMNIAPIPPYVRIDVASGNRGNRGEREGQASE